MLDRPSNTTSVFSLESREVADAVDIKVRDQISRPYLDKVEERLRPAYLCADLEPLEIDGKE